MKHSWKRLAAMILVVAMALTLVPMTVLAEAPTTTLDVKLLTGSHTATGWNDTADASKKVALDKSFYTGEWQEFAVTVNVGKDLDQKLIRGKFTISKAVYDAIEGLEYWENAPTMVNGWTNLKGELKASGDTYVGYFGPPTGFTYNALGITPGTGSATSLFRVKFKTAGTHAFTTGVVGWDGSAETAESFGGTSGNGSFVTVDALEQVGKVHLHDRTSDGSGSHENDGKLASDYDVKATQKEGYVEVAITAAAVAPHKGEQGNGKWLGFSVKAPTIADGYDYKIADTQAGLSATTTTGHSGLDDHIVNGATNDKGNVNYIDVTNHEGEAWYSIQWTNGSEKVGAPIVYKAVYTVNPIEFFDEAMNKCYNEDTAPMWHLDPNGLVGDDIVFTKGTEANTYKVTGTLKFAVSMQMFNEQTLEQNGYYLPIMVECTDAAKVNDEAAEPDEVEGGKKYYSVVYWVTNDPAHDMSKETYSLDISWDGTSKATTYTLDMSGLTLEQTDLAEALYKVQNIATKMPTKTAHAYVETTEVVADRAAAKKLVEGMITALNLGSSVDTNVIEYGVDGGFTAVNTEDETDGKWSFQVEVTVGGKKATSAVIDLIIKPQYVKLTTEDRTRYNLTRTQTDDIEMEFTVTEGATVTANSSKTKVATVALNPTNGVATSTGKVTVTITPTGTVGTTTITVNATKAGLVSAETETITVAVTGDPGYVVGKVHLHDQAKGEGHEGDAGLTGTYTVVATDKEETIGSGISAEVIPYVEVAITATDLAWHQNGATPADDGYWIGFSVTAPEGATRYKCAVGKNLSDIAKGEDWGHQSEVDEYIVNGTTNDKGAALYMKWTTNEESPIFKIVFLDEDGKPMGEEVTYKAVLNVTPKTVETGFKMMSDKVYEVGYPISTWTNKPATLAAMAEGLVLKAEAAHTENIIVTAGSVKYVCGFTGFNSAKPAEQQGYYIPLMMEIPEEYKTSATIKIPGGEGGTSDKTITSASFDTVDGKTYFSILTKVAGPKSTITYIVDLDGDLTAQSPKTYTITFSDAVTFQGAVEDVQVTFIRTMEEYKAAFPDDKAAHTPESIQLPWLMVNYKRNGTGEVTFTVKNGSKAIQFGTTGDGKVTGSVQKANDHKFTASTTNQKAYMAAHLISQETTDHKGQLWLVQAADAIYHPYTVTVALNGTTATGEATLTQTHTVAFLEDTQAHAPIDNETVKANESFTVLAITEAVGMNDEYTGNITVTSTNTAVATVETKSFGEGARVTVTGVAAGTATIIARLDDGTKATLDVTVTPADTSVYTLSLKNNAGSVANNGTINMSTAIVPLYQIVATAQPTSTYTGKYTVTTGEDGAEQDVIDVEVGQGEPLEDGQWWISIVGLKAGETKVTIATQQASPATATFTVKVVEAVEGAKISFITDKASYETAYGENSWAAIAAPEGATDEEIAAQIKLPWVHVDYVRNEVGTVTFTAKVDGNEVQFGTTDNGKADGTVVRSDAYTFEAAATNENAYVAVHLWSQADTDHAGQVWLDLAKDAKDHEIEFTVSMGDESSTTTDTATYENPDKAPVVNPPVIVVPPSGGDETEEPTEEPKTETHENEDGSVTTTVTDPDGTVTETTTQPDGSEVEVVTSPEGDVTITATDAEGNELAKVEVPAEIPALEEGFVDVPEGHWAEESINNMAALGLVNGVNTTEHVYDMSTAMTRGALATVLYRMANGKEGLECTFGDVPAGEWYTDAVAWAAAVGVVTGYDENTFGPGNAMTRQQLATMLYRFGSLLGLDMTKTADLSTFVDSAKVDGWAQAAMAWCVGSGIINGRGNNDLAPTVNVTRAEAAVMLDRFMGLLK